MKSVSNTRAHLAGILCTLVGTYAASAAAVILDKNEFNAALQPGSYLETFESLSDGAQPNDLQFSGGGYGYSFNATGTGGNSFLVAGSGAEGKWISTYVTANEITVDFLTDNVTAVGGDFFAIQSPPPTISTATFTVYLSDGTSQQVTTTTGNERAFIGFTTAIPIESLTIGAAPVLGKFMAVDNFVVGEAVLVPEPWQGAAAMAVGILGFALIRRKRLGQ